MNNLIKSDLKVNYIFLGVTLLYFSGNPRFNQAWVGMDWADAE